MKTKKKIVLMIVEGNYDLIKGLNSLQRYSNMHIFLSPDAKCNPMVLESDK